MRALLYEFYKLDIPLMYFNSAGDIFSSHIHDAFYAYQLFTQSVLCLQAKIRNCFKCLCIDICGDVAFCLKALNVLEAAKQLALQLFRNIFCCQKAFKCFKILGSILFYI